MTGYLLALFECNGEAPLLL
ncbi:hypothetical protein A2U01_0118340 [Trifolium medium]|uniref:Uncharacterized protein n=1 Tax=Trifolium medium TaxID=97028 RepID=A0A392WEV5_9FABA|nr:hypothetical protein [Trifolium medium]